jgi:clan AA aspartic protease
MSQEKALTESERENNDLQGKNERLKKEIAVAMESFPQDYLDELLEDKTGGSKSTDTSQKNTSGNENSNLPTEEPGGKMPIREKITIKNTRNTKKVEETCLADTGASGGLTINKTICDQLGLKEVGQGTCILADGSRVSCSYTEDVTVCLGWLEITCKVCVLPNADEVLLGEDAIKELEKLGARIDTRIGKIVLPEPPKPSIATQPFTPPKSEEENAGEGAGEALPGGDNEPKSPPGPEQTDPSCDVLTVEFVRKFIRDNEIPGMTVPDGATQKTLRILFNSARRYVRDQMG